jgi:hypothetical protein
MWILYTYRVLTHIHTPLSIRTQQDAPASPAECFTLVKAIVNPLLRRSRGGQRVRCIRSLQEARKCVHTLFDMFTNHIKGC